MLHQRYSIIVLDSDKRFTTTKLELHCSSYPDDVVPEVRKRRVCVTLVIRFRVSSS
jgi:hypothetical protein